MSFVMPSKYGAKLPVPKDSSVRIREVPEKLIAVAAFSGSGFAMILVSDSWMDCILMKFNMN